MMFAFLVSPVVADDLGDLDCVIEPHTVIDLSSRVDGIVETLEVQRGEFIEEDQILVLLEAGVERATVAEAKARADATAEILAGKASSEFAQRREDRMQELARSQAVTLDQLDEMTTETELSKLELQQARENKQIADHQLRQAREILKRHTLRSPIRGIVVQRYLAPGESTKDVPVMRLAEIDPLRVEVIVPVAAFGAIQVGQPALVSPEAPMDGQYPATVTVVDGVADAASGTFRVRLGLSNEDYAVPSGLKCRVQFLPFEDLQETQMADSKEESPEPDSDVETAGDALESSVPRPIVMATATPDAIVKSAPTSADPTATRCQTIGPLKDAPQADQVMAAIAGQATWIDLREELLPAIEGYQILSPKQASLEDARSLTEKMAAAGFNDFYVLKSGPLWGRVALGVYRDKQRAEETQAKLTTLGFETDLLPRSTRQSRYWLRVELLEPVAALDLAEAQQSVGRATALTAASCDLAEPPSTQKADAKPQSPAPKPIVVAAAKPEPVVKSAASPTGSAGSRCRIIGPIKNAPQAEQIMSTIAGQATQSDLRNESRSYSDGYQILSPKQASLEDARALTDRMKAAGYDDFYIFKSGPYQGRVSLGVYRDRKSAENTRATLADFGFATEIWQRLQEQAGFWLEVELLATATALDLTEAQQSVGGTTVLTAASCDLVTAQK